MSLMVFIILMNVQNVDLNLLRVFDAVLHESGVTPFSRSTASNTRSRLRSTSMIFISVIHIMSAIDLTNGDPAPNLIAS